MNRFKKSLDRIHSNRSLSVSILSKQVIGETGLYFFILVLRYLRGPKFEQLQQAIAAGESAAVVATPHNPFLHMHRNENAPNEHDIQMTHLHTTLVFFYFLIVILNLW